MAMRVTERESERDKDWGVCVCGKCCVFGDHACDQVRDDEECAEPGGRAAHATFPRRLRGRGGSLFTGLHTFIHVGNRQ